MKASFSESIFKRKNITWRELKAISRHSLGYEKISNAAIKNKIPEFITNDNKSLIAFRFHGMHPMVGYRSNHIFYVLWFDIDFTLYDH